MKRIFLLLTLTTMLLAASSTDRGLKRLQEMKTEQRTALVIGNNKYKSLPRLNNPINDARAMRNVLKAKGFEVLYAEDASKTEFKKMIKQFYSEIYKGGVGLFYFAGHGIQVDGQNFLVATDSEISDKDAVEFETVALDYVTKKMRDARNRFNIVILDACRNDPFSRSGGGGLAPVRNARGIFVAYATEAGSVAKDGSEQNGVFTKHLIEYMNKPITIEQVFKQTRRAVYEETNHEQFPGVYNQSMGEFYFTLPQESSKKAAAATVPVSVTAVPASITAAPANAPAEPQPVRKQVTYSLTVDPDPIDARVLITNIRARYYDGIELSPGIYNIKVKKTGFESKQFDVELNANKRLKVVLNRITEVRPATDKKEEQFWSAVVANNTVANYQFYLQVYPKGSHVQEARNSIAALQAEPSVSKPSAKHVMAKPAAVETPQNVKNLEGVWYDAQTGLMWQDTDAIEESDRNWERARKFCDELTLAGFSDWHLPKMESIQELFDKKENLKHVISGRYWSSDSYKSDRFRTWGAYIDRGLTYGRGKADIPHTRCVRGSE